jgi:hypothetical protein
VTAEFGDADDITWSATRSASCSYLSPGSLTLSLVCSPNLFLLLHSSQVPVEPPQAHLRWIIAIRLWRNDTDGLGDTGEGRLGFVDSENSI